jgi:hypothetical protein
MAMLHVFGDESHKSKSERVFAVAALFGTEEQWDGLRRRWTARLGDKVFHAAECESDRGQFANSGHADNQKLYADLTRIVAESHLSVHLRLYHGRRGQNNLQR